MGVVNPQMMRDCNKCRKDVWCNEDDKLVNQDKEFSANLNELKRQAPDENGFMLPWYKTT